MSNYCSVRVFSGGRMDMRGHICHKPVKMQLPDGKWVCAFHSPENVAKREVALEQKYVAKSAQRDDRIRREQEMRNRAAEWPLLKQRISELEAELRMYTGDNR